VDWGTSADERRKEIVAYLREGQECFLFDNIQQGEEIKSPILAQALTAGEFKARILGVSEMTYIPAQSMFVFIGNNLNMSTELSRRLMTVELRARDDNPATRKVAIRNVERYCQEHRNEVIGCLIKMVQEGVKMDEKIEKGTGFSFWDGMVRNPILSEIGVDIATGIEISQGGSEESMQVGELIMLFKDVFGLNAPFTSKDAYLAVCDERFLDDIDAERAKEITEGLEKECRALRDAMEIVNAKSTSLPKSTGRVLSGLANRVRGDYMFVREKTKSKKNPIRHWIEYVEEEEGC
jgi:hypothetical protein